jgi:hypothetical protein
MRRSPGNDLNLGQITGSGKSLMFPRELRDKHLYICGSTGTGKSKFLENLIRQDIVNWRKSKCGLILLDPHGSLYDSLMQWLSWHKVDRPVVPIDLRQDEWVVSYNMLRQRETADPAVVVDNFVEAMAYVWGQGSTNQTPLFARWASNVIGTLYEKGYTLLEAAYLIDRLAKHTRQAMTANMDDKAVQDDWDFINTLNPKDFEAQIGSTVNRLQRFIKNQTMRCMFGQPEVSLDLGRALDEGSIILVSLATERAKVSKENAELFATLLLSDLWTAAQERGKRENIKPFYVYLDEFQRFVTPTIAENLDEARGYGLHLTMAHQFPNQLLDRGDSGKRVYNSIMENASSKIVFRLSHRENLEPMAEWLFTGTMNPDDIKHELYSTKVLEYREEDRTSYSRGSGRSAGHSKSSGGASGEGEGSTEGFSFDGFEFGDDPRSISRSKHAFESVSSNSGESYGDSESESETTSSVLVPVLGKELSHVQFRSLEEQLFRSMAVLFDQQERRCVARLVGMSAPASIHTPTVSKMPASKPMVARYVGQIMGKLPFALSGAEAQKRLEDRKANFPETLLKQSVMEEPVSAKRRIA